MSKSRRFYNACIMGEIEAVREIINDPSTTQNDLNWTDDFGGTPFYMACCYGHLEIAQLLLNDLRIDVNKADHFGKTPFYDACVNGHKRIVEIGFVCSVCLSSGSLITPSIANY